MRELSVDGRTYLVNKHGVVFRKDAVHTKEFGPRWKSYKPEDLFATSAETNRVLEALRKIDGAPNTDQQRRTVGESPAEDPR